MADWQNGCPSLNSMLMTGLLVEIDCADDGRQHARRRRFRHSMMAGTTGNASRYLCVVIVMMGGMQQDDADAGQHQGDARNRA